MSINASLFGQMITFAIFVWFCMKFIWPRLMGAIEERQKTIADGLAAADKGQRSLEAAEIKMGELINDGKQQAANIVAESHQRASGIVEEAKAKARVEYDKILTQAKADIEQEANVAKRELYNEVSQLVVLGAEKVIGDNISTAVNDKFIEQLIAEVK